MKFGEKLRQLRLEKGFTQEEVASAVNVSRRTYIGYEQEGRYPKKRDLYSRLAQVLDTETSYLDKDAVMIALQKAYFDCKEDNKKYTPKKYRKK